MKTVITILTLIFVFSLGSCKKPKQVLYETGTFPDTTFNLSDINSQYDDFNADIEQLTGYFAVVFSSNRETQGGKFDLVTGSIEFMFDKNTGYFGYGSDMINDPYLTALVNAANTAGDDLGPYRILGSADSYEYLITTSESPDGDLDLMYMKYLPQLGMNVPDFGTLNPVTILNSSSNDGYITFDISQTRVFFNSDREGPFNIYTVERPSTGTLSEWLSQDPVAVIKMDSINSDYDDKCPVVSRNFMVFASNRPGGMGGFDLYYSVYKDGAWNSPVNFGPKVNTEADEYRPVIGYHPDYTNHFLVFSSNRSGGKGGFDLYLAGVEIPEEQTLIFR